jgi:hypothetical protein
MMQSSRFPFVLLLLSPLIWQDRALGQASPLKISLQEARRNLLSLPPAIRVQDLQRRRPFESAQVKLIIDVNGHVRSAEIQKSSMHDVLALAVASALQYRPFIEDGITSEVEYDEYVRVLPPEKLPATHVRFPKVDDLKSVQFSLLRSSCFGPCPDYELQISGEGVVTYFGKRSVAVNGQQSDRITPQAVQELLQAFEKADFFSLEDRYAVGATDLPTYTISIKVGSVSKTITDYSGEQVGMPDAVAALERQMDSIAGTIRWTGGGVWN